MNGSPSPRMRLLLVDDSPQFLEALQEYLRAFPQVDVAGAARSGEEAIVLARSLAPDAIVMDLKMPGIGGLEAMRAIKAALPPPRVLAVTLQDHNGIRRAALDAGADFFIAKENLFDEFPQVLEQMASADASVPESQARLQAFMDHSPNVMFIKDRDGRYLHVNRKFCASFELDADRVLGRSDAEIFGAGQPARFAANDAQALAGTPVETEEVAQYRGGARTSIVSKFPIFDARGNVVALGGIATDITERKAVAEGLAQSEERFRSLIELSSDWYWEQDAEFRFTRFAGGASDGPWGEYQQAAIGQRRWEMPQVAPLGTTWDEHRAQLEARATYRDFEFAVTLAGGEVRYVTANGEPVYDAGGRFAGYRGTARDISAGKRAEEALRQSEQRKGAVLEAALDCVIVMDEAGRIVDFNAAAERTFGIAREEAIGREIAGLIIPEALREAHRAGLQRFLATGEGPVLGRRIELTALRADAGEFPVELSIAATRIGGGWIFTAYLREISERRRAAEALEASERRFRALIEHASDLTVVIGLSGRIDYVSPSVERIGGYRPEELLGTSILEVTHPGDHAAVIGEVQKLVAEAGAISRIEVRLRRRDGSWGVFESLTRNRLDDPAIGGLIVNLRDVSERRRAEQLRDLEHAVVRLLAAAPSSAAGLAAVMRVVCESEGWERSTYWRADDASGVLRFGGVWDAPGSGLERYTEASREMEFRPGEGIAGRVWQSGEPLWSEDFSSDPRVLQRTLARETALRAMFVFPVVAEGRTIGVLAFFSREFRAPDERLLATTRSIGSQLGQFLRAKGAEEARAQLAAIVQGANDAIIGQALDGTITSWNPAAARLFGYRAAEALGRPFAMLLAPDRPPGVEELARLPDGEAVPVEIPMLTRDGRPIDCMLSVSAIRAAGGEIVGAAASVRDISAQKEQARKVARLQRIRDVLSGINATIVRVRERQQLLDEACRIAVEQGGFGISWISRLDAATLDLVPVAWAGEDAAAHVAAGGPSAREGTPWGRTVLGFAARSGAPVFCNDLAAEPDGGGPRRHDAIRRGFRSVISTPLAVDGAVWGTLTLLSREANVFNDEELKLIGELAGDIAFALGHLAKEERLHYLAYHDPLTGLPNRALLEDRLAQHLRTAGRGGGRTALVLVDLERLRVVNESLGRHAVDALLQKVAARLGEALFQRDSVARLHSDVFAVLLPEIAGETEVARVVQEKILACIAAPFEVAGQELRISARAGVAIGPDDAREAHALISSAETALRQAKASRERYQFYAAKMSAQVAERLALENRLRRAVERREFVLHYQAKVDLAGGHLTGLEALLRWQDPEQGLVAPGLFIPLLEETGMIVEVGAWALEQAVAQHAAWSAAGLQAPRISVNVSQVQLKRADFVATVRQALAAAGDGPAGLDLEITESMAMEDVQANVEKLRELRALGVGIAIDDFGTGYSSLQYIARLPITALKVDRAFVNRMANDTNDVSLVATIITLARNLDLKVIAEGVETADQAKLLRLLRCDEAQGYLYGRPQPAADIEAMLAAKSGASPPPR